MIWNATTSRFLIKVGPVDGGGAGWAPWPTSKGGWPGVDGFEYTKL